MPSIGCIYKRVGKMGLYGKIIDLQKLQMAWSKVRKNKPAAGTDNITWEQFDAQKMLN